MSGQDEDQLRGWLRDDRLVRGRLIRIDESILAGSSATLVLHFAAASRHDLSQARKAMPLPSGQPSSSGPIGAVHLLVRASCTSSSTSTSTPSHSSASAAPSAAAPSATTCYTSHSAELDEADQGYLRLPVGPLSKAGAYSIKVYLLTNPPAHPATRAPDTADGKPLPGALRLVVAPATPSAAMSVIVASTVAPPESSARPKTAPPRLRVSPGQPLTLAAGELGCALVRLRDSYGNAIRGSGGNAMSGSGGFVGVGATPPYFVLERQPNEEDEEDAARDGAALSPEDSDESCAMRLTKDGRFYAVRFSRRRAGRYLLRVWLENGDELPRPLVCVVSAATLSAAHSTLRGGARGVRAAAAGAPLRLTIHARDALGNRCARGGGAWRVRVQPEEGSEAREDASLSKALDGAAARALIEDCRDGSYKLSIVLPRAGRFRLHVENDGGSERGSKRVGKGVPISGSPFPIRISPSALDPLSTELLLEGGVSSSEGSVSSSGGGGRGGRRGGGGAPEATVGPSACLRVRAGAEAALVLRGARGSFGTGVAGQVEREAHFALLRALFESAELAGEIGGGRSVAEFVAAGRGGGARGGGSADGEAPADRGQFAAETSSSPFSWLGGRLRADGCYVLRFLCTHSTRHSSLRIEMGGVPIEATDSSPI